MIGPQDFGDDRSASRAVGLIVKRIALSKSSPRLGASQRIWITRLSRIGGNRSLIPYRLLIITHSDMLLAGNQTMAATVKGYLNGGFDVLMLTSSLPAAENTLPEEVSLANCDLTRFCRVHVPVSYCGLDFIYRACKEAVRFPLSHTPFWGEHHRLSAPPKDACPAFAEYELKRCLKETWAGICFQVQMYRAALKWAWAFRPDAVYGYEIFGSVVATRIAKQLNVPAITRFQGTVMYPCLTKPFLRARMIRHAMGLKADADLTIMADDGTRGNIVLDELGVKHDRVRFWRNGVTKLNAVGTEDACRARNYVSQRWGIRRYKFLLLCSSRLEHWKRVDRAIRIVSTLDAGRFHLLVLGDGSAASSLRTLSTELGCADRVTFAGPVSHQEALQCIAACDALLSLYDFSNLCNTVLEALMMGKVLVSIDDGSLDELVTSGQNAILVDKARIEDTVVTVLEQLSSSPDRMQSLADAASSRATKQLWTWDRRMEMEVNEVCSLIGAHHEQQYSAPWG